MEPGGTIPISRTYERFLDQDTRDMWYCGTDELQDCWFFHLSVEASDEETWRHGGAGEDGSLIDRFDFFLADFRALPKLVANYDDKIDLLLESMESRRKSKLPLTERISLWAVGALAFGNRSPRFNTLRRPFDRLRGRLRSGLRGNWLRVQAQRPSQRCSDRQTIPGFANRVRQQKSAAVLATP